MSEERPTKADIDKLTLSSHIFYAVRQMAKQLNWTDSEMLTLAAIEMQVALDQMTKQYIALLEDGPLPPIVINEMQKEVWRKIHEDFIGEKIVYVTKSSWEFSNWLNVIGITVIALNSILWATRPSDALGANALNSAAYLITNYVAPWLTKILGG